MRGYIEDFSSDSKKFKKGADLFYSVNGVGEGVWGLRNYAGLTPPAVDAENGGSPRVRINTYRILRDTELVRGLKQLHQNRCQICGETLNLPEGRSYSEGHHLQPLGSPHNGPDSAANVIVLCPNHHALCDYGAIALSLETLRTHPLHQVGLQYLAYHNERVGSISTRESGVKDVDVAK